MNWISKTIKGYWWVKGKDGSLTWASRRRILVSAFGLGVFFAGLVALVAACFLSASDSEGVFKGNDVFSSALVLATFGIIFGLGNWIIKNDDAQKQFKDTFIGQNELLFSNAVRALFEKPVKNENSINIHGFKEIARLAREKLIEKDRIDAVTAANHNLRGANLDNALLKGLDLRFVQLWEASLERADLRGVDFRGTNLINATMSRADLRNTDLRGANLREANLTGADLRGADLRGSHLLEAEKHPDLIVVPGDYLTQAILQSAVYDEHTKFPEGYDPEQHGLIKEAQSVEERL